MEHKGEERRKHKRFSVEFNADCKAVLEDGGEKSFRGWITDISRGGVYMRAKERIPVGAVVELAIKLPDGKTPLKTKAVVRWKSRPAIYPVQSEGVGMMFTELGEQDWARISELIT